jgi:hypothetical protein
MEQVLPSGLTPQDFEQQLAARYPGTHLFLQALPAQARERVYERYRTTPDVHSLRELIIELYSGSAQQAPPAFVSPQRAP